VQEGGGGDKERREMSKSGLNWNPEDMNEAQLAAVNKGQVTAQNAPKSPRKSKYNAVKTMVDGITFPSKKEARVYESLKCRQGVKFILCQVAFPLPGGYRHRLDFMVVYYDGRIEYVEAKGMDLAMGKMKRKQVEEIYDIKIEVI